MVEGKSKYPILNEKYELRRELGEGKTSKVYLAYDVSNHAQKYAVKILKNEYINSDEKAQESVIREVAVLETLKHKHIVQIYEFGDSGRIVKASGKVKEDVVFIILEYVAGGLLFEVCQDIGQLGEDCARVFFKEIVTSIEFMQSQSISHRDLKLENILVDENLTIKVADFGFATENAGLLESYKGTPVYMAPEIALGKKYTGYKADLFSAGVILFTLVRGIFPFMGSTGEDQFYQYLLSKDYASYWEAVEGEDASKEFKDLMQQILAHNPDERPALEKLKSHPWMVAKGAKTEEELKLTVAEKMMKLREERKQAKAAKAASKGASKKDYRRGDDEEEEAFLQEGEYTRAYKNSTLTEWATTLTAAEMWEKMEECVLETSLGEPTRDEEKKKFYIQCEEKNVKIKVKFFYSEEEATLKVHFVKKEGQVLDFYSVLKDMQQYLDEELVVAQD